MKEYGTHYWGLCDVCRKVKHCSSKEERDAWEADHPHEREEDE